MLEQKMEKLQITSLRQKKNNSKRKFRNKYGEHTNQNFTDLYDNTPNKNNHKTSPADSTSIQIITKKTKYPKLLSNFDDKSIESVMETLSSNTDISNIPNNKKNKKTGKIKKQKSIKPFEVSVVNNKPKPNKTSNPGVEKDRNLSVNEEMKSLGGKTSLPDKKLEGKNLLEKNKKK